MTLSANWKKRLPITKTESVGKSGKRKWIWERSGNANSMKRKTNNKQTNPRVDGTADEQTKKEQGT
jgi:hypothetical protein